MRNITGRIKKVITGSIKRLITRTRILMSTTVTVKVLLKQASFFETVGAVNAVKVKVTVSFIVLLFEVRIMVK